MAGLRKSQHLKLDLKKIHVATENFKTCIGKGGFGMVYKGELSLNGRHTIVAVKKLSEQYGQGLKEFLTEIELLTGQQHRNLISLLGYCEEGKEKILVYEYAAHGSLDRYIRRGESPYTLRWVKRLKICADAAHGLNHLHRHAGKHQAIIHRDVKSANILLDGSWVAKVSDLGLSKLILAGLDRSAVISRACGTPGYCEPEYFVTGIVKIESDVYSFGMVLFEVISGRLCLVKDKDGFSLTAPSAKYHYEKNKLEDIIDPRIRDQMSPSSLSKFSKVAYQCLNDDRQKRPSMDVVTQELEEALKIQMEYESRKKDEEYLKKKQPNNVTRIFCDMQNREAYHQYGEESLEGQRPPPAAGEFSDMSPDGNVNDLFYSMFGLPNPYGAKEDMGGTGAMPGEQFPRSNEGSDSMSPRKAVAIEHALPCSLEDLFKGTTKKMKISRKVTDATGKSTIVEEILVIGIKPGWKKGTKITFAEKGNEQQGVIPSDIVFIIEEKPHAVFERDGNDLVITQQVSQAQAFTGYPTQIKTLDGRCLPIRINSVIGPTYEEVVRGEGMPISKEPGKKGNLRVKFDIKFAT